VKAQLLGYKPFSKPGVVITAGKPVTLDITLEDVIVHEEKVVEVTGERQLVEVKQGATVRRVNAAEIRNLAVTTVGDVLQQQAGISTDAEQIHVRGGRTDETVFVVNGVANRDLVTGQSTAGQLNARSVSEVNVATGAFDVRYGNALSGVVEIKRIIINGFKSAFMPYPQKARMLREVNLEIDRIFMEEFPDDYDRRLTSV